MGLGSGTEIQDPEKTYSGSRIQKGTGSRIRIRYTAYNGTHLCPAQGQLQAVRRLSPVSLPPPHTWVHSSYINFLQ